MNIFVAVLPKNKKLIDKYKKSVTKAAGVCVPFYNMEHKSNLWANDTVIAANFSIHEESVSIKNYASYTENEFLTFNGIPTDERLLTNETWSDVFLKASLKGMLNVSNLGGYYSILDINKRGLTAYTSITRSESIYWTETPECYVVGNRPSLVYASANNTTKFKYNTDALISMCTIGWQTHDEVQYKGLKLLENGANISINSKGYKINYHSPYKKMELPKSDHPRMEKVYDQVYEEIAHEFIKGLKAFRNFSGQLKINMTGGKDSRVIAAFAKEAGLDFTTTTSGGPKDRDVIVAKEVADILNVPHSFTPQNKQNNNEIPKVDIFQLLQRQVYQSDGASNIYDNCYPIRLNPNVQFAGHGGACFKGGYGNANKPFVTNEDELIRFLENLSLHNSSLLLTEYGLETQRMINSNVIQKFNESSFENKDFYDYMYTVYREGRAMANARHASGYGAFQNSIYLNSKAITKALEIPLEYRTSNNLYFNLLNKINPELAWHRFSDSRWDFEVEGPSAGTTYEDWKKRTPLPPSEKTQQIRSWRHGYDDYLRPIIKDYLLSNPSDQLFEIIDYKKLKKLLNKEGPSNNNVIRSVFGIMSVSYFVKGHWKEISSHEKESGKVKSLIDKFFK